MDSAHPSLMLRLLRAVAQAVMRHPRWFVWPQLVLAVVCVVYSQQNLKFSASRNDLVSTDQRYHRLFLELRREFSAQQDIVAVVESEDPEKNRQFIERLGARVLAETNLFTDVFFKGDLPMLGQKALLFLDEPTLLNLQETLGRFRPFVERFAATTNLNSLFAMINRQFRTAMGSTNRDQGESLLKALPALERIVLLARDSLQRPGVPPSPGINALFGGGPEAERQVYLTFADGRLYILSLRAPRAEVVTQAIGRLRELVQQTRTEVPGVNADITGGEVLEMDEMRQSQRDTLLATIVSLVIVALIFIFGYHETGRPLKATFCLLVGLCYSVGYITLVVGHLNILTITFAPMLVGMAIDFGVHLITRYEEELRSGRSRQLALTKAMVNTGQGIYAGAFTTAGAFFAMALTDFAGVREMGLITGGGLLVCLVPMMTMLPALLLKGRQNVIDRGMADTLSARERIEALWMKRPGLVTLAGIGLAALCLTQLDRVHFDYDLRNMQSKGLPAVVYEKKLIAGASKSVLYGAVIADSLPNAVDLERQFTNLSTVASVESIAPLLTEDPSRKLAVIGEIKRDLSRIRFADTEHPPVDLGDLSQTLTFLQAYLGQAAEAVRNEGDEALYEELRSLRRSIGLLRQQMATGDRQKNALRLASFESALFDDLRSTFETLKSQDNSSPLREDDLPAVMRHRFVGRTGKYLLQIYPKTDVWIRTNQEAFVREMRTVTDEATGEPVQLYEYTSLLKQSYEEAAIYALIAMAVLVFIQFRSLKAVLLAHLPVALAAAWSLGLMGILNVPFNPANIMTLPLVVGIGVTFGVHILTRFKEEQNPAILAKSTGKAVLVSGLTTVAGFASLMLARHQGIVSLGFVMSVGVATAAVASVVSLPAVLMLGRRPPRPTKKRPSDAYAQRRWVGRNRGYDPSIKASE